MAWKQAIGRWNWKHLVVSALITSAVALVAFKVGYSVSENELESSERARDKRMSEAFGSPSRVWKYTEDRDPMTDADESTARVWWWDNRNRLSIAQIYCGDFSDGLRVGIDANGVPNSLKQPDEGRIWYRVDDHPPVGPLLSDAWPITAITDGNALEFAQSLRRVKKKLAIRWEHPSRSWDLQIPIEGAGRAIQKLSCVP